MKYDIYNDDQYEDYLGSIVARTPREAKELAREIFTDAGKIKVVAHGSDKGAQRISPTRKDGSSDALKKLWGVK